MAQAVVGLGNPGAEYRETRHNVGQRVADVLARTLSAAFETAGPHQVALGRWQGETLYVLKPRAWMNACGPVVAEWARAVALGPEDLIVVFDDLDLPLGVVRVRMRGSAGGHNGVKSLIEALGTEDIRRVKVGIGRPDEPRRDPCVIREHVLSPFRPEERPIIEQACAEAAHQALRLVAARSASTI